MAKTQYFTPMPYLRLVSALALSSVLSACALPKADHLPGTLSELAKKQQAFEETYATPVEVVRLPKGALKGQPVRPALPQAVARTVVDVSFSPGATLHELVQVLSSLGVQVAFRWESNEDGTAILNRQLPFMRYQGDLGSMMSALRTGLGTAYWHESGMIFLSDRERYSVAIPQNEEVMKAVAEELKSLGAMDIVTSLRGGRVMYSAKPTTQHELIGPFLERMTKNLAMVRVQVAVVSLGLTDETSVGFDWNAFSLKFDSRHQTLNPETGTGAGGSVTAPGGSGNGSTDGTGTGSTSESDDGILGDSGRIKIDPGAVFNAGASGIAFGRTSLGKVFGTYGAVSVTSAINFLSNFGNTKITQNVELSTLSGSEVKLRSGQEVPYVKGVDVNTTSNNSNLMGSTQTETVDTGITVSMTPFYDAEAQLVTMGVDVELKSIIEFVELSAGNQVGTLTQPLTQDQSLSNIIRLEAGKTVVIGGLQFDSETYSGVEPAFMRETGGKPSRGWSLGKKSQQISRNALFLILRPSLTVFVPEEGAS